MKIKILNKNLATADDYSSAKTFEVDEGSVFTDVKSEILDNATIIISNVEEDDRLQIEPYDIVEIFREGNTTWKYMCVDTYTETMVCVNPKIYRYQISLFSETKLLEGIILPNLKITKMPDITRSIYDYINQYLTEYCPQIRIPDDNSYSLTNKFNWMWSSVTGHDNLSTRFNNECPEMQWNTPTLREVLNDLMMVNDCIVILKNGNVDYIELTKVNNKNWGTDTTHVNYVTRSESSEDYVSELQCKLENVTNNDEEIKNTVIHSEYFSLTCPDDEATLTTQNMTIKTQYPIYRIKSLKVMFPASVTIKTTYEDEHGTVSTETNTYHQWYEEDLCKTRVKLPLFPVEYYYMNLVYEHKEWVTKNVLYTGQQPSGFMNWQNYREYTLYYTRGGNEIENFNNLRKFLFLTDPIYDDLCINIVRNTTDLASNETIEAVTAPQWYDILFKIEYETLEGCLFRASKGDIKEHERVVIDNQTNSYVDSYAQGFLEYQKANRLGNEQLQINARYNINELQSIMEIGDVYDDSVIYQCQYQYYTDHVEVNAIATKNYVLREYFTGVKSKIRSWKIADGSDALTRHDLVKYYCELSWEDHGTIENDVVTSDYLLTPFSTYNESKPIDYCFVRMTDGSNYFPAPGNAGGTYQNSYYSVDLIKRLVGNSMVFTFAFQDNYWAGKQFDPVKVTPSNMQLNLNGLPEIKSDGLIELVQSIFAGTTGIPTQQYKYTDSNGENIGGEIILLDGIRIAPDYDAYSHPGSSVTSPETFMFMDYVYRKPRVWEKNIPTDAQLITVDFSHKKDSQEITNISTQFEFCSDTTNICIAKEFLKRQKAINIDSNDISNLKLISYNKSSYDFRNPNKLPTSNYLNIDDVSIDISGSRLAIKWIRKFTSVRVLETTVKRYCFYLNDGNTSTENILLSFVPGEHYNVVEENDGYYAEFILYLNVLKIRNKNIYDADNHYLIVGQI